MFAVVVFAVQSVSIVIVLVERRKVAYFRSRRPLNLSPQFGHSWLLCALVSLYPEVAGEDPLVEVMESPDFDGE